MFFFCEGVICWLWGCQQSPGPENESSQQIFYLRCKLLKRPIKPRWKISLVVYPQRARPSLSSLVPSPMRSHTTLYPEEDLPSMSVTNLQDLQEEVYDLLFLPPRVPNIWPLPPNPDDHCPFGIHSSDSEGPSLSKGYLLFPTKRHDLCRKIHQRVDLIISKRFFVLGFWINPLLDRFFFY